ncbi:MAG: hypothetical protein CSA96_10250 [Bacteroidetes bacterium]|nr:MAG: hypothetical protein CSA96_10250 [Bacteroidota bacterium]
MRFTQGLETIDMNSEGKKIRSQRRFSPGGVNVNFVERLGNSRIAVRSFERGVEAETLSCGTGVSASVLCAALDNKKSSGLFEVKTPGGQLQVAFKRQGKAAFSDLFLIGPAIHVYDGSIELRHAHRMV